MKEFKVNEYITLRLENGKTNIYVNDYLFEQCKFLLLQIPVKEISNFDEVKSIDEAAERLDHSLEPREEDHDFLIEKYKISPEEEFTAHCSNLQAWVENNYNTNLLHSNLAFPLLKRLVELGDRKANRVFKDEIAERFLSCYPTVVHFLLFLNYLNYLTEDEIKTLLKVLKVKNKLLYEFLEPIFIIKGYLKKKIDKIEFKAFIRKFYNDVESGKYKSLNLYEEFGINHNLIISRYLFKKKLGI